MGPFSHGAIGLEACDIFFSRCNAWALLLVISNIYRVHLFCRSTMCTHSGWLQRAAIREKIKYPTKQN